MDLRLRLKAKGFEAPAIAAALGRLQEVKLQSDDRFAERYAQTAVARGKSARLIAGELRRRGVEADLAEVAATASPEEELERARALARSKSRALAGKPRPVVYRRIAGLLARRGYDPETCRTVATEVAGDVEEHELGERAPDMGY